MQVLSYLYNKDFTCISDEGVFVWNENVRPAGGRGGEGQPAHLSRAVPGGGGGGGGGIATQHQLETGSINVLLLLLVQIFIGFISITYIIFLQDCLITCWRNTIKIRMIYQLSKGRQIDCT